MSKLTICHPKGGIREQANDLPSILPPGTQITQARVGAQ
jgi:hypothetical protein